MKTKVINSVVKRKCKSQFRYEAGLGSHIYQKNMNEYDGICGKYEEIRANMKKIWRNMKQCAENMEEYLLLCRLWDLGKILRSSLLYRLWGLEEFRALPSIEEALGFRNLHIFFIFPPSVETLGLGKFENSELFPSIEVSGHEKISSSPLL